MCSCVQGLYLRENKKARTNRWMSGPEIGGEGRIMWKKAITPRHVLATQDALLNLLSSQRLPPCPLRLRINESGPGRPRRT